MNGHTWVSPHIPLGQCKDVFVSKVTSNMHNHIKGVTSVETWNFISETYTFKSWLCLFSSLSLSLIM